MRQLRYLVLVTLLFHRPHGARCGEPLSVTRVTDASYRIAQPLENGLILLDKDDDRIGFWNGYELVTNEIPFEIRNLRSFFRMGSDIYFTAEDRLSGKNMPWLRWDLASSPVIAQDLPVRGSGVGTAFLFDEQLVYTTTDPILLNPDAEMSAYSFDGAKISSHDWFADVRLIGDSKVGIVGNSAVIKGPGGSLLTFDGDAVRTLARDVPYFFLEAIAGSTFVGEYLYYPDRTGPESEDLKLYRTNGAIFEEAILPWPAPPDGYRFFEDQIFARGVSDNGEYGVWAFDGEEVRSIPLLTERRVVEILRFDSQPNGALSITALFDDSPGVYASMLLTTDGFVANNLPELPGTRTVVPGDTHYYVRIERENKEFELYETEDFVSYRTIDTDRYYEFTWLDSALNPAVQTSQGTFLGGRDFNDEPLVLMNTMDGRTLERVLYTSPDGTDSFSLDGSGDTFNLFGTSPRRFIDHQNSVYINDRSHGIFMLQQADSLARVDYNLNGVVDVGDLDIQAAKLRTEEYVEAMDLNRDGRLDLADRVLFVKEFAKTWFGDSDLDGRYSTADLVHLFQAGQYEDGVSGNSTWSTGDWNGDGDFTTTDFVLAFQDGGYERGPRSGAAAVPEPTGSAALLVCAAGALRCAGRRRMTLQR